MKSLMTELLTLALSSRASFWAMCFATARPAMMAVTATAAATGRPMARPSFQPVNCPDGGGDEPAPASAGEADEAATAMAGEYAD